MGYKKIVDDHCSEINILADQLFKLANAYRLLVASANDLNGIALAKKKDVKNALRRAEELGALIEDLIETIDYCDCNYFKHCRLKSDYISSKIGIDFIRRDIDEELSIIKIIDKDKKP